MKLFESVLLPSNNASSAYSAADEKSRVFIHVICLNRTSLFVHLHTLQSNPLSHLAMSMQTRQNHKCSTVLYEDQKRTKTAGDGQVVADRLTRRFGHLFPQIVVSWNLDPVTVDQWAQADIMFNLQNNNTSSLDTSDSGMLHVRALAAVETRAVQFIKECISQE